MKSRTTFLSLFFLIVVALSITVSSNSSATAPLPSPRQDATVSFSFDGLMAICFGNPARVSAGLLDVIHHTPKLAITRIEGNKRSNLAVLRAEQLRGTL